MTYLDSLLMIEKLKNLVSAYCEEWVVHFHFTSETEFEVHYFERKNWQEEMNKIFSYKLKHRFPHARIWMSEEHIYMVYHDKNFYHYGYDLVLNQLDEDYVLSDRFAEWTISNAMQAIGIKNFMSKVSK